MKPATKHNLYNKRDEYDVIETYCYISKNLCKIKELDYFGCHVCRQAGSENFVWQTQGQGFHGAFKYTSNSEVYIVYYGKGLFFMERRVFLHR